MKECGKMVKNKEMVLKNMQMETFMKDSGKMERNKEMVLKNMQI